ncbi:hypothetical protein ACFL6S_17565 [Candidatus Poribacteria bacterium]
MKRSLLTQFLVLMVLFPVITAAKNIWIQAEDSESIVGKITKGDDIGLQEKDAFDDFLVVMVKDNAQVEEWYAQYTVKIPKEGMWVIWGRFKHPAGRDVSWSFDGTGEGPNDIAIPKAMDNVNTGGEEWFWSSGNNSADLPVPNLKLNLPSGEVTFRIYERESPLDSNGNSRLDLILLTDDLSYIPDDEAAENGLEEQKRLRPVEGYHKLATSWGFLKRGY